ncbi:hypothetical protein FIBSPDRAFT_903073 [Athelia psychrophila]|uniref:Uncharacterized protein n=1 Tax=Athelia psychrophila TaxID=1759441 RepID=A0A167WFP1_9AGAM|nr:hypothetical protein FIBSPDRAFT_903073 [Fibularhizoctonia sp. CBS 109695]
MDFRVYVDNGILDDDHPGWAYFKLDLVQYWQARGNAANPQEPIPKDLSFMEDLISNEHELSVTDVSPEKIVELLAEGHIDELTELLVASEREYDVADHTMAEEIV